MVSIASATSSGPSRFNANSSRAPAESVRRVRAMPVSSIIGVDRGLPRSGRRFRPGARLGHTLRLRGLWTEQVRIDDLARDRGREFRAETDVLHQHGYRDARLVDRRERNEPGMVLELLGDVLRQALAARDGEYLCGAGFAC